MADTNPEVEGVEAEAKAPETEGADSAPAGDVEPAVKPDLDKVQQRFDKLTREKHQERIEKEYWREQALKVQAAQAKPQPVAPAEVPTLEAYDFDQAKYEQAKRAYEDALIEARVAAALAKREAEAKQVARTQTFEQRQRAFLAEKPDYIEKVLQNDSLPISKAMADVMAESELGPQVAYFLADNPDRALVIAQMGEVQAAREIGRIEARLEAEANAKKASPAPTRVSQAPPPPPKIAASDAAPRKSVYDENLSMEEFMAMRERQLRRRD